LYALTDPQHTPWQVPNRVLFHDVPCRFCFQSVCPAGHGDCLAGVAPERVADAVQALLAQRRPRPQAQVCSSFRIVSI
jgi:ADP-heptose:LPS heptosyltransferase